MEDSRLKPADPSQTAKDATNEDANPQAKVARANQMIVVPPPLNLPTRFNRPLQLRRAPSNTSMSFRDRRKIQAGLTLESIPGSGTSIAKTSSAKMAAKSKTADTPEPTLSSFDLDAIVGLGSLFTSEEGENEEISRKDSTEAADWMKQFHPTDDDASKRDDMSDDVWRSSERTSP